VLIHGLTNVSQSRRRGRGVFRAGCVPVRSVPVRSVPVRSVPVALLVACLSLAGVVTGVPSGAMAATVASSRAQPLAAVAPATPLKTSCKQVVHLGDSTSDGLVQADFLPDPAQRVPAQYARVGVSRSIMEVVGANSIVETLPGDENGYEIAQGLVAQGYRGCWVIALGTNDAADVAVGSNVGLPARIQRMMSVIGHDPVLWVNVKTLLSSGPYAEANMQMWDNALLAACPSYPNMRVFDWAHLANPAWFTTDGIHYTSTGSAIRAAAIADALATGFPAHAARDTHISGAHKPALAASAQASRDNCVVNWSPTWHLPTTYLP
jgi:hypothetical protein